MKKMNNVLIADDLQTIEIKSKEDNMSYSKPKQLITNSFAKELNNNHTEAIATANKNAKDDANAFWYSLEELENYINHIKTEGIEKGYKIDGIRFYIGKYPNKEEYKEKAGMTTIFLSPTGYKTEAQKSSLLSYSSKEELGQSSDVDEISPLNYGSMGNPPKMSYPSN
ncbi:MULTISPECIES: hypothetical protein [unclassified Flavobacterium]|nr:MULTISPECIES: hypothetical protein [unclassified Flavobacterium]